MANATRVCKSCQSTIPQDAAKCPMCGEWREDIKRERNLCYLWSFIAILPIIVFLYGWAHAWWPPAPQTIEFFGGVRMPSIQFSTFDWATFLASPSGLLIVVAFGVAFGISVKYYISVSKKMDNWIWL
jgi:predicted nucleic acid-binding Zn ribbon protein